MSEEPKRKVSHRTDDTLMTKRSEAGSVDINKLMERYTRTGLVPQRGDEPKYGDFSSGLSYHQALSAVREAEEQYLHLPVQVRKLTQNDPGQFLDLVMTPEGRKQLQDMSMPEAFVPEGAPEPPAVQPEVPADSSTTGGDGAPS